MEDTSTRTALQGQQITRPSVATRCTQHQGSGPPGASQELSGRPVTLGTPATESPGGNPPDSIHLIHEHKVYTNGTWESPSDPLKQRLKRYSTAKLAAKKLTTYLDQTLATPEALDRSRKLTDCASWLLFRQIVSDGSTHLHAAPFCQQPLLCQACAIRRAARSLQAYIPKLLEVRSAQPGRACLFVTFTVQNGDLKQQIDLLFKSLQKLTTKCRLSKSTGRRRQTQMCSVVGGVGSVEVKRGKGSKLWHPHYHGIWILEDRISWKALQQEWSSAVGYPAVSWFKYLKSERQDFSSLPDHKSALGADLLEVFKYPLKFGSLKPADQWEAFKTLSGSRLIRSFGALRGVEVSPDLLDPRLDWDGIEFVELFYKFMGDQYRQTSAPSADKFLQAWNDAKTAVSQNSTTE